jgi:serine/threonine protein kinase
VFGEVYFGKYMKDKSNPIPCAIKKLERAKLRGYLTEMLEKEIQIINKINHPNVVKFLEFQKTK